ncbi:arylsulfotransferase family protein [Methylomonas sp. SURF-2]|uniref:Arylsulfotransferase family protein n=1 Tax=Methylomonas subterranea TaxID=2952225 RepID=A0ABT1TKC1_9GAMM|nr:arylsulfotransferase family protein [Methylomonas sp. SURF-2]MCQ8105759.1 arylsulfotransferase family protein [Methylomonas sp. SURF-2]
MTSSNPSISTPENNSTGTSSFRLQQAILIVLCSALSLSAISGPSVFPTGTTRYDPSQAYNSFVLFTGGDNIAHLIDLNGNSVHEWPDAAGHSTLIDPALNGGKLGHIFVTLETTEGKGTGLVPGQINRRIAKTVAELDWDAKPVWTFGEKAPGGAAQQHHDWARLPNGNSVILANLVHPVKGFKQPEVLDDVIYEVNPTGEVVWKWLASEHLNEFGFSKAELKLVKNASIADYLHVNNLKVVGPNRWFAAGDQRFAPENLLIDSRNANFIAIIDRKTGKIVWRLGPRYADATLEGQLPRHTPRPVDQISAQHDAHIIPEGLPGAGNLLVFDNQGVAGYPPAAVPRTGGSRVLEIAPIKNEIVWQYTGESSGGPAWSFRSTHISAARRLPNGNTFIDEGQSGRLFQVTPAGDIVWEYINPYPRTGKDAPTGKTTVNYQLYRGQPVPYDWVPAGTPHAEKAVIAPELGSFHLPSAP